MFHPLAELTRLYIERYGAEHDRPVPNRFVGTLLRRALEIRRTSRMGTTRSVSIKSGFLPLPLVLAWTAVLWSIYREEGPKAPHSYTVARNHNKVSAPALNPVLD